jgi:signal transduction histidine kinase
MHTTEGSDSLAAAWWSHSLRQRVGVSLNDPEGLRIFHRDGIFRRLRQLNPHASVLRSARVDAICISLAFPIDQVADLDEIRIGPPEIHPVDHEPDPPLVSITPLPTNMVIADFNSDGRPDLLHGRQGGSPILMLGQPGGLGPGRETGFGLDSVLSLEWPVAIDIDQDGCVDLAAICGNQLRTFRGLGDGHLREMPAPRLSFLHERRVWKVLVADILPGGGPELVLHRLSSLYADTLLVARRRWHWRAGPFPNPEETLRRNGYRQAMACADVDGDLDLDVYACNSDLYLQDGDSLRCATSRWLPERGRLQSGAAFGDIDNDGDMDLFIAVETRTNTRGPEATHRHSLLYRNDGDHFTDITAQMTPVPSRHARFPILEDFDLDGDLDLFYTQDLAWEPSPRGARLLNAYYQNDGTGRFARVGDDHELARLPYAADALSCDADRDGDPDLLIKVCDGKQIVLKSNPSPANRSIRVRVLDRRSAPHAAAAHVALLGPEGKLAGFRQTGVGSMAPGLGEATFGCAGPGPYQLRVTFPSCPAHPIVRAKLFPGATLTVVEPAWDGPLGTLAGSIGVSVRQSIRRVATLRGQVLLPIGLAYGALMGGLLFGTGLGSRQRWQGINAYALAAGLFLLLLLPGIWAWPGSPATVANGRAGLMGVTVGAVLGTFAFAWRASRRALPTVEESRLALLEAIDGFSHASWLRHLGGLSFLLQSQAEGGDPGLIQPRLQVRLNAFEDVIDPQVKAIERVLPRAGLESRLVATFRDCAQALRCAVGVIRRHPPGTPLPADVQKQVTAGVICMHESVESIFGNLGREIRTEIAGVLHHARDAAEGRIKGVEIIEQIPAQLPPVFAVPGLLANILENVLVNGMRAAVSEAELRTARVEVRAIHEGGLVTLHVEDSGPGIPPDRWVSIFEPHSTGLDGHGRGLPYARRMLHQFDGKIRVVASSPEDGTHICVTLRAVGEKLP